MFRTIGTVNSSRSSVDANRQEATPCAGSHASLAIPSPSNGPLKSHWAVEETSEAHGQYSHADHPIVVCMRVSSCSGRGRHSLGAIERSCGVQVPCGPGSNGSSRRELHGKQKMSASVITAPTLGLARTPSPCASLPDPTWFDLRLGLVMISMRAGFPDKSRQVGSFYEFLCQNGLVRCGR
jgi:hypothetical protein